MEWAAQYVGIPYASRSDPGFGTDGMDCYMLARKVLDEQAGIKMPSMLDTYADSDDMEQTRDAIVDGFPLFEEVTEPKPFDLVLIRIMGHATHIGVFLGNRRMLHTMRNHMSVIEQTDGVKWRHRIEGYFRWTPFQS